MGDRDAPRIVVLGAGFAGLHAVRRLGRAGVDTLWIDARNYHTFLPLLYQVATAGLEPQEIAYPARAILRRFPTVDFRMVAIASADPAARTLRTAGGDRIPYRYLIVATGGSAEDFGIPGAREYAHCLYDLEDARGLRNHVLLTLERAHATADPVARARLLTFVVVGGGATGVEMSGALAEFRHHVAPRDYRFDSSAIRIILVEAGPHLLSPYPDRLRARTRRDLEALGVEVRTGVRVERVTADRVELAGHDAVPTATVVWAAGIRAATVTQYLGLPTGRGGRLVVEPMLRVRGQPEIFAAGDVALVEGAERLPQVAQNAMQQGACAAANVLHALRGETLVPYRYRDKGSLATIGRSRAVAVIGRFRFAGRLAWWIWLFVHLIMLIGFRNRVVVLVNWAWSYVTYDFGLRAIIGPDARHDRTAAAAPKMPGAA